MSFTTILKKLRLADLAARAIADDDFAELVSNCARDLPVTAEQISSMLAASGKTLSDLENAVRNERQRIADLSVAARRSEILDALHENNEAMIAEDSRYADEAARLFKGHGDKVAELRERDRVLSADLERVQGAERRLVDNAGSDRLQQIGDELRELANQEQRLASNSLRNHRGCQRQRDEIVSKRVALTEERDRIRAGILTSS